MRARPMTAVLGCTGLEPPRTCLQRMGFMADPPRPVAAEAAKVLYSLSGATTSQRLVVPDASGGDVLLVVTPEVARERGPWPRGSYALDVYSRDLDASLATLPGMVASPFADYALSTGQVREVRLDGPDGLRVVLVQMSARRASALDRDGSRLHSEIGACVSVIDSADAATDAACWTGLGLDVLRDEELADEQVAGLMALPEAVPLRLQLFWDAARPGLRVEVLSFAAAPPGRPVAGPLTAGDIVCVLDVDDLDVAVDGLDAELLGPEVVLDGGRVLAGRSPGGVAFQLRQPAAAAGSG